MTVARTRTGHPGRVLGTWLADRTIPPRTRAHYRSRLDKQIPPTFAETSIRAITPHTIGREACHKRIGYW
jgi:hypothetical protein